MQVWQHNWPTWLLMGSSLSAAIIGVLAWRRRALPAARYLAILCFAVSMWSLADGLCGAAVPLQLKLSMAKIEAVGTLFIGPCWLLMVHAFLRKPPLSRGQLIAIWALPVCSLPIACTNWRGLLWPTIELVTSPSGVHGVYTHGPVFWVNVAYINLLVSLGVILLLRSLRGANSTHRTQVLVLVATAALPLIAQVIDRAGNSPFSQDTDLPPFAFSIGMLLLGWIMLRGGFLEIGSLARKMLLNVLPDGVLVLDNSGWLIEANPAAGELLGLQAKLRPGACDKLLAPWPPLVTLCKEEIVATSEIAIKGVDERHRHLEVNVAEIEDVGHAIQGRLVTLRDVTKQAQMLTDLQDQTSRLTALLAATRAIGGSLEYEEVLGHILEQARTSFNAGSCLLYEYTPDGRTLRLCTSEQYNEAPQPISPTAELRPPGLLAWDEEIDALSPAMKRGEPFTARNGWIMVIPLRHRERELGELVCLASDGDHLFDTIDLNFVRGLGEQASVAMANAELYERIRGLHLGNLRALSSALSAKDHYTFGHAGRVAAYSAILARELGWSAEHIAEIQDVAYLHDIGKIGVPDRVLHKTGPLNRTEWNLMRQHPVIGGEIVAPLFEPRLASGVRHHHERFDGGGYPEGLTGDQISLVARAICVADSYDAMSSNRSYKHGLTYEECREELKRNAGTQFDPEIIEAFLRTLVQLRERHRELHELAQKAASLVDPANHVYQPSPPSEPTADQRRMAAALVNFRETRPELQRLTTFAQHDGECFVVLDLPKDVENALQHGHPWLPDDRLAAVLQGHPPCTMNTFDANEFGVWATGVAPLHDEDGGIIGALTISQSAIESSSVLQQRHSDLSRTLASMLRTASLQADRAELDATSDGLTSLFNHSSLHEQLDEQFEQAQLHRSELTLLFIDIDNFKQLNKTFGYKTGDELLRRVARTLERCTRHTDLLARYGGDEFLLILPATSKAEGQERAQRIREQIADVKAPDGTPLTASVGIATFPQNGTTKEDLLREAINATLAAKRARGSRERSSSS